MLSIGLISTNLNILNVEFSNNNYEYRKTIISLINFYNQLHFPLLYNYDII